MSLVTEKLITSSHKRTIEHEVIEDLFTLPDRLDKGCYQFLEGGLETEYLSNDTILLN